MSKTTKDLTAGTVGGIAQVCVLLRCTPGGLLTLSQVLVGQPFDIVKVVSHKRNVQFSSLTKYQRMQTASKGTYTGMLHCAGGILKNEGPLAFYKVRAGV